MNNNLIEALRANGRVSEEHISRWHEAAQLLAALDAIGRDGANALVKIDGSRSDGAVYTVMISGSKLGESFFRRDGAHLHALLQDAVEFYNSSVWKK